MRHAEFHARGTFLTLTYVGRSCDPHELVGATSNTFL